ncbi:MAG: phosphoribosylamine--glycine ligase [Chloroflexota bacterium]|nr:phosphoribosylamine--glycine ligase [Chloroflexota bacterium]
MTSQHSPKRVLVMGSGGREHALAWALSREPDVGQVIVAPGNAGMKQVATVRPAAASDDRMAWIANDLGVDLVVVGPEGPLVAGVADHLARRGIAVFGPGRDAARLEGSKAFCRDVARAAGVPMAEGAAFEDDEDGAIDFSRRLGAPVVIKADGLAGGKGVTVCATLAEAEAAIRACRPRFGLAARRIVVERALIGLEASVIAITDGASLLALPAARDHKRLGDDDRGPNTGGMGVYSPLPDLPDAEAAALTERIHRPILGELARRGISYSGALYAGLMLTADGPYLLECNVRFGDPETQVLLPRLSTSLAPLLLGAANGRLARAAAAAGLSDGRIPGDDAAVGVVLAAAGYPDEPRLGDPIDDRDGTPVGAGGSGEGALTFWSGVRRSQGSLVTNGGRVATIVGRGDSLEEAAAVAYRATESVTFPGRQMRRDIGRIGSFAARTAGSRP